MRLSGKIAIVTGAGDGIGRGIAVAFAEAGADVAVCDINDAYLNGTRDAVRKAGRTCYAQVVDVRQPQQIEAFVAAAANELGGIDILVNNAAVMPVMRTEDLTPQVIDQILSVNLRAPILFSKHVIPFMRQRRGGSIIHMSSATGHNGHPGVTVYGATKGALMALARGQAVELAADGIRVNTVSPGAVDSPMLHRFLAEHSDNPQAARKSFDRLHPRGVVATVAEVAAVFVFLAGEESANITATDIRCDGGYCVQGTQPKN